MVKIYALAEQEGGGVKGKAMQQEENVGRHAHELAQEEGGDGSFLLSFHHPWGPPRGPSWISVSAVSSLAFIKPCSSTLPVKSPGPMRLGALAVMSWFGLHRVRFDLSLANLVGVEERRAVASLKPDSTIVSVSSSGLSLADGSSVTISGHLGPTSVRKSRVTALHLQSLRVATHSCGGHLPSCTSCWAKVYEWRCR